MTTALDRLKEHTVVVADTGDFNSAASLKIYPTFLATGAACRPRDLRCPPMVVSLS